MDPTKINPIAPMLSATELFDLIEQLRVHGFTIEPRHHFQAQRALDLALALQLQGSMPSLARMQTLLAPIFCHTPAQQDTFYRYFENWLQRHTEIQARLQSMPQPLPSEPDVPPVALPPRRFGSKYKMLGLGLGLIFLGSMVYWWLSRPPKPVIPQRFLMGRVVNARTHQPQPGVKVNFLSNITTTDDSGRFSLKLPARDTTTELTTEAVAFWPETFAVDTDTLTRLLRIKLREREPATLAKPVIPERKSSAKEDSLRMMVDRINAFAAKENAGLNHSWFIGYYRRYFKPLQWSLLFSPELIFLFWYGLRWRRRRWLLERFTSSRPRQVETVVVRGAADELFRNGLFRIVVQRYRRHREVASPDLDLPQTIQATLQQGGLFTPHYAARYWLPEYLVLIDRTSLQDQRARFLDDLLHRFSQDGVPIERYFFERDPRVCQAAAADAVPLTLPELLSKHPQHRLLIFSESADFLNIRTAEPYPWLEQFLAWAHPAIFLPSAQGGALYLERELKNLGFQVWPVSLEGLARHIEWIHFPQALPIAPSTEAPEYPELLETQLDLWLDRTEPEAQQVADLMTTLKQYLGSEGMFWLGACAVYPEVQWELTLYLVTQLTAPSTRLLTDAEQQQVQQRLLDLTRLPWFRYGFMPDWLRERLLLELNASQHQRIRQILRKLLKSAGQTETTAPDEGFKLPFIPTRPRDPLADLIEILRNRLRPTAGESPLQDYVFLNYMTGSQPRKLAVLIPKAVQRLFFRKGRLFLGMKPLAALCLAFGFGLMSWFGLALLEPDQIIIPTFHVVQNQDTAGRALPQAWSDSTLDHYLDSNFDQPNFFDTLLTTAIVNYQSQIQQIWADHNILRQRVYYLRFISLDSNRISQMASRLKSYFILTLPVTFRSIPDTLDNSAVGQMLRQCNFYEIFWNSKSPGFENDFQVSLDNLVVYDHASGLTWQRGGTAKEISFLLAQAYVDSLNWIKFAGFQDWRLPTLEEAMSLMERRKELSGNYIMKQIFDNRQLKIWTTDLDPSLTKAWVVYFDLGFCHRNDIQGDDYVRAVRSGFSSLEHELIVISPQTTPLIRQRYDSNDSTLDRIDLDLLTSNNSLGIVSIEDTSIVKNKNLLNDKIFAILHSLNDSDEYEIEFINRYRRELCTYDPYQIEPSEEFYKTSPTLIRELIRIIRTSKIGVYSFKNIAFLIVGFFRQDSNKYIGKTKSLFTTKFYCNEFYSLDGIRLKKKEVSYDSVKISDPDSVEIYLTTLRACKITQYLIQNLQKEVNIRNRFFTTIAENDTNRIVQLYIINIKRFRGSKENEELR